MEADVIDDCDEESKDLSAAEFEEKKRAFDMKKHVQYSKESMIFNRKDDIKDHYSFRKVSGPFHIC
jgi:hypothetical protein